MKKVLTMLLAALGLLQIAPAAFADEEFGSSAWLAYWDVDSALREIPGVGPATETKLLRKFRSVKRIANASVDDLAAEVGPSMARKIHSALNGI